MIIDKSFRTLYKYNGKINKLITLDKICKEFYSETIYNCSNIYWLLEEGPTYYYVVYINRK